MAANSKPSTEGKVISRVAVTVVHRNAAGELCTDEVVLKPVALVAAERHFSGEVPPIEGTLYASHFLLTKEGRRKLPKFNEWLDTIEAIDEHHADPLEAPPAGQ